MADDHKFRSVRNYVLKPVREREKIFVIFPANIFVNPLPLDVVLWRGKIYYGGFFISTHLRVLIVNALRIPNKPVLLHTLFCGIVYSDVQTIWLLIGVFFLLENIERGGRGYRKPMCIVNSLNFIKLNIFSRKSGEKKIEFFACH